MNHIHFTRNTFVKGKLIEADTLMKVEELDRHHVDAIAGKKAVLVSEEDFKKLKKESDAKKAEAKKAEK